MQIHVQKWGNSLALRIPKSFALEANVDEGTTVDISFKNGKLIITPISEDTYSLEGLLSKVNDENIHKETYTGKPVGQEVW
ncbi:MAG: AbrB/MazE/SpoVT family DNA-binding domain-containing protein [Candidatus Anammoxibacter sp.]